ncbi:hypothetical protein ACFL1H_03960 [Nanoarchaeota archaeon]
MSKKGQIVLYAIILVLIVLAGFLTFRIISTGQPTQPIKLDINSVKIFIDSCVENTAEESLLYIGLKGGYSELPDLSTEGAISIPYYLYEGQNLAPNKSFIQNELNKYMDSQLFFCLLDLDLYREIGFEIESSPPTTSSFITNNKVIFNINFPLEISKGDQTQTLNRFKTEVPVRLGKIINFNNKTIHRQKPDKICISCIVDEAIENDLYVSMSNYDNSTYLVSIFDKNSTINNLEYMFVYAYKLK